MIMVKDYYLILGLDYDATQEDIRAAYRDQVKELHPDHYGEDREPFLAVQEAYAALSDPVRRKAYDRLLRQERQPGIRTDMTHEERILSRRAPIEPLIPTEPVTDFEETSLTRSFETFRPSFEETFDRLWSNFLTLTRPKPERIESLSVELPLTPDQARRGGEARIMVPARVKCSTCLGYGGVGLYECWRCRGEGAITGEYPVSISFPPGTADKYAVSVPLDQFGIHNFYMTVHFRVTR